MVKTFENYMFARDAWSLLVAPAWYPGLVRVGSLKLPGNGNNPVRSTPYSRRPQLMPAPVRPGSLLYSQEVSATALDDDNTVAVPVVVLVVVLVAVVGALFYVSEHPGYLF